MNYKNQLEKLRDLELETEKIYNNLETQLLNDSNDENISKFIRIMFQVRNDTPQFRYVIDTFINDKLHKLELDERLSEDIINELNIDNKMRFEFYFKTKKSTMIAALDIELNDDKIITNINPGVYIA